MVVYLSVDERAMRFIFKCLIIHLMLQCVRTLDKAAKI